jgi:hypothetical protein
VLRVVMIAAAAALCLSGCKRAQKAEAGQVAVGWRPLGAWSGRGNVQTDSFNVEGGQWRIHWEARKEVGATAGTFRITVHSAVSGRPLLVAVEQQGAGHGTATVNEDPRLFHLVIEASGLDWSVSAEEAVVGSVREGR